MSLEETFIKKHQKKKEKLIDKARKLLDID
jgi:hypothetical protein